MELLYLSKLHIKQSYIYKEYNIPKNEQTQMLLGAKEEIDLSMNILEVSGHHLTTFSSVVENCLTAIVVLIRSAIMPPMMNVNPELRQILVQLTTVDNFFCDIMGFWKILECHFQHSERV